MENRLVDIYEATTEEDRAKVAELVRRAKGSPQACELTTITPGMGAILFYDFNKQNREWDPLHSEEYCDEIRNKKWGFASQSVGFFTTGDLGDGQHTVSGCALAGSNPRHRCFWDGSRRHRGD
jgi:hypothetical protein